MLATDSLICYVVGSAII